MTKKLFFAAALAIVAVACTKKEEGAITTTETEMANPETTVNTTVTPMDSATTMTETEKVTTADQVTTTKTTTGEVIKYVSNDGKTSFSGIFDADAGTAAIKNESTNTSYDMKRVQSASGAKYEDKDGNFFWTHQGGFDFGKGEKTLISGKEAK